MMIYGPWRSIIFKTVVSRTNSVVPIINEFIHVLDSVKTRFISF